MPSVRVIKEIANINDDIDLISPKIIEPIQDLKINHLGNKNPRLHTDEVLLALSISAATNPTSEMAMKALEKLDGCQMHSTVILSDVDLHTLTNLGINVPREPDRQSKTLHHK